MFAKGFAQDFIRREAEGGVKGDARLIFAFRSVAI
jgi:hypothetical protein